MNYYFEAFRKYGVFEGRSTRKEYWMFVLFQSLILLALFFIDYLIFSKAVLAVFYGLASIIPTLSILVRRLHDVGRSAWSLLWYLVPVAGGVVLLVLALLRSAPDNKYGPSLYQTAPIDAQPTV